MSRQRRRDTSPEIALRRRLHALGLRFRVDSRPLGRERFRADIVLRPSRVAVFVDGCFWHACPAHATFPRVNADWWASKLQTNVDRDRRADQALAAAGWQSLRVWEHEDMSEAADRIARLARLRRAGIRPDH